MDASSHQLDTPRQMKRHYDPGAKVEDEPPEKRARESDDGFELVDVARRGALKTYKMDVNDLDLVVSLDANYAAIRKVMEMEIKRNNGIKVMLVVNIRMSKENQGKVINQSPHFRSKTKVLLNELQIAGITNEMMSDVQKMVGQWINEGSGWIIDRVLSMELNIARYQPMKAGSYIDLPPYLKAKKAIINVQNKDDQCLKWALLSALHPVKKNSTRVKKYITFDADLNFADITFPVKLSDIPKVEKLNHLGVNVYGYDEGLHPLYISECEDPICILLIHDEEEVKYHYCWIKDFNRLLFDQNKRANRKYFCKRCLSSHKTESALTRHKEDCNGVGTAPSRIVMPDQDQDGNEPILQFKNFKNMMKCPYIIYADLESIIQPVHEQAGNGTVRTGIHEPCSFGAVVIRSDGEKVDECFYRGEDAMEILFGWLESKERDLQVEMESRNSAFDPAQLSDVECRAHADATSCWICSQAIPLEGTMTREAWETYHRSSNCGKCQVEFDEDCRVYKKKGFDSNGQFVDAWCYGCVVSQRKVHDHDHITGEYRGAAHSKCNLELRIHPYLQHIPIVFHNLKHYDAHHLISFIGGVTNVETVDYVNKYGKSKSRQVGGISVIPNNMEKYISFTWRQFRFIDSLAFLNASLDKLVKTTPPEALVYTNTLEKPDLLSQKGVYPYEYMDSFARFNETELPSRESFHSTLSGSGISLEEYERAQHVWQAFECEDLAHYHDIYLQADVYLLADVFENFRKTALNIYHLDPANYYTLPGYSWDALLKLSNVKLELLTDVDKYLFVEKGKRGGISMASHRYAKANNKHMDDFDETQPSSYIQYLDANNLYGWAMSQYLPVSNFHWISEDLDTILGTEANSDVGYIVECDLVYPAELHRYHNDYPLAPEHLKVTESMLSPYQRDMVQELHTGGLDCDKLVPNLMNKEKHVLHYRNLQLYLDLGMKVSNIHRVLKFTQAPWMKDYIDKNTELRKECRSDFEKDFFKLMNNSVFGKTMENVRGRVDLKVLRTEEEGDKLQKLINKPTYKRHVIFNPDLAGIESQKVKTTLNKPIYVGMSILDLAKHLMYDFYNNHLKRRHNIKLLYTDTDSLIIQVFTDDLFEDIRENIELYDTSNYAKDRPCYSEKNKKVVGKFKDELGSKIMTEFVGIRSKVYSYTGEASGKRAKGVNKSVLKKTINHDDYRICLLDQRVFHREMTNLRSHRHRIYSETTNKVTLCPLDTKRFITSDGIMTLAYGYVDIPQHALHRKNG